MTNEQIVRTACQVVWTDGDVSRVDEFYHQDFEAHYPITDWGSGLDGIRNLATVQREAFPDYRERIDSLMVSDDQIIVELTIRGTNTGPIGGFPATGKPVEFKDVTICRIRDGKIVEQRGLSDYLTVYQQLGLIELPQPPASQ